ncbi:60S ribosomal protein L18 [Tupaia chinensis]|uniref:60S ribosomal protein L18 n=1 Tax=Tupaia chinensis TaxID=246437 RepID=L9KQ70_TUPCH|nr:60S ribosomal protein L18 [Tupaia chinensis]
MKEVRTVSGYPEPVSHPSPIHNGIPDGREMRVSTFNEGMICKMKLSGWENKTAVVVETITDDVRIQEVRKLKGCGTILLSSPRKCCKVYRHFRKAPGTPHSHTKPYVCSKGRKFECVRGQRAS